MSSAIIIGETFVGKTSMVHTLSNTTSEYVEVLQGPRGQPGTTEKIEENTLELSVNLPSGNHPISVKWVDTPGELFKGTTCDTTSSQWEKFLNKIENVNYIILLLHPLQTQLTEKGKLKMTDKDMPFCYTTDDSRDNFNKWMEIFRQPRLKANFILICRHKFDTCYDQIDDLGKEKKYRHNGYQWQGNDNGSYFHSTKTYFKDIENSIDSLKKFRRNQNKPNYDVRHFVTTIKNRSLLELPWIFIASREAR